MKMITLFLPEKYIEMLDTLVATGMYPNRSEALRMAAWKFLHESVKMLKNFSKDEAAIADLDSHLDGESDKGKQLNNFVIE